MENNEFNKRVEKYVGQLVTIKYYEPNTQEVITKRFAINKVTDSHILVITAYNNTLGIVGLATPNIECICSEENNDLIENPNYAHKTNLKL